MGRTAKWLADQRPVMVALLKQIEARSGQGKRGDLAAILASQYGKQTGKSRSASAMRRAWVRWTTDSAGGVTPSVLELAAVIRVAVNQRWLDHVEDPASLDLIQRLEQELEAAQQSEEDSLERSWRAQAWTSVDALMMFMERRLQNLAQEDAEASGEVLWDASFPPALVVQQEFSVMVESVLTRMILSLAEDRSVEGHDALLQLDAGWPRVLRGLASQAAALLNSAAEDLEDIESSSHAVPLQEARQRKNLFGRT